MKSLLVGEFRQGGLIEATYELAGFGAACGDEASMLLVGSPDNPPLFAGRVYLADVAWVGESAPGAHRDLVLEAIRREDPDQIVFLHSSYGWDIAPRVALALGVGQVSQVVAVEPGADARHYTVPIMNGKLRMQVVPATRPVVVTIQAGAFAPLVSESAPSATVALQPASADPAAAGGTDTAPAERLLGYEAAERGGVDLAQAEVIVSAGRGIGTQENLAAVRALAQALGGELGASRPLVDAGWVEHERQVGSTGQTVAPKLYVACGISGAIQHLAGMRRSGYIVAINKDREAPIAEVADVLAVGDVNQLLAAVLTRLQNEA